MKNMMIATTVPVAAPFPLPTIVAAQEFPFVAESGRRNTAYDVFMKSSAEQQIAVSGIGVEYRTVKSSMLLREC